MYKEELKDLVRVLPNRPGVYQYYDESGTIIYVGKAIDLKKRVASYFTNSKGHSNKVKRLVANIVDIKHIVVETETDALLLENNLIKKYQPKYNVMLKDDKTYPWICIKNERFPRVFSTRKVIKDGSEYFGPYVSSYMMKTVLELIHQIYPLRNCNYNLSEENVDKGKFKVCLEYHMGNCLGPCEGKQDEDDYQQSIINIRNILKGNLHSVSKHLREKMAFFAEQLEFERAQMIKERLEILDRYQAKSTVVSPTVNNVDVYAILTDVKSAYINFLKVVSGSIIQAHTLELKKQLDESDAELLALGIVEIRSRLNSNSKEIVVPFDPGINIEGVQFHIPQRGDKKKLLELSHRNAMYYRKEKWQQVSHTDPEAHAERLMEQMKADLRLNEQPRHIECFDNSNIQGTNPVAACVVFKNGKPAKREYRHFNIKTVEGPDDFASMEEVVYRRYKRLKEEGEPLPQLIIIDGGKGQLSSALKSLDKLELRGKIAILGIAKRLEELFYPDDPVPLYLDKRSETLKVIQQLRNEAHRFGIEHHRKRRSKSGIKTSLTDIKGIGTETSEQLLKKFKSIKRLAAADETEVAKLIGPSKAKLVFEHFNEKQEDETDS